MLLIINIALIASLLLSGSDAFTSSHGFTNTRTLRHVDTVVRNSKRSEDLADFVVGMTKGSRKDFLLRTAAAIAVAVAATPVLPVSASEFSDIISLPTIQIADTVKELDFSLPTYEDIKSSKASAENSKSLTVQPKAFDPKSVSLRTTASVMQEKSITSSTENDVSTSSSNPLGALLPSMSKKGPKPKKSYDGYEF